MRFYIIAGMILALCIAALAGGCGLENLHWVPDGQTPPPGSKPVVNAIEGVLGAIESTGWGDLVQILAGAVGCGGIVAVGRRIVRNRQTRKTLESTTAVQGTALQEIIAGVQELMRCNNEKEIGTMKEVLADYQKTDSTRKLVAATKVDLDFQKVTPPKCKE